MIGTVQAMSKGLSEWRFRKMEADRPYLCLDGTSQGRGEGRAHVWYRLWSVIQRCRDRVGDISAATERCAQK
jgi:hypothetical protein